MALCTTWCMQRARATVHERLEGVGATLVHYARSRYVGDAQRVQVNGLTFTLQAGTTNDDVPRVLSDLGRRCRTGDTTWDSLTARRANAERGYVACLDVLGRAPDANTLRARFSAFAPELDVSELGTLMYVTAERRGDITTYVIVRSLGSLPLARAFVRDGDAPGLDLEWLPRPQGAHRVLSASTDALGSSLLVFQTRPGDQTTAMRDYAHALEAAGFAVEARDERRLQARSTSGRVLVTHRQQPDTTSYFALLASPDATADDHGR
jgi:hypothetical protein